MSFMQMLQLARMIVELIPVVTSAVKAVEEAIPGEGKGEQKLAIVRTALESVYKTSSGLTISFDVVWSALKPVIDQTVKSFNESGIFGK